MVAAGAKSSYGIVSALGDISRGVNSLRAAERIVVDSYRNAHVIDDELKREFYIELCRLQRWSSRQLQERIGSMLFEPSAISKKPEDTVRHDLARLRQEQTASPDLLLKDPYVLDFLNLDNQYLEKDLEDAILREIEHFLLELGAGFTFVAGEKRLEIDHDEFYIDLLFL